MKLIWNGHACFTLETETATVVLDPYLDNYIPGVGCVNATADAVFCSHQHNDHKAKEVVTLTGKNPEIQVEELHTFHDPEGGALRGTNIIHLFTFEGMKVAHCGDLGCDPAPELKEKLMGADAIMIPIGGFYTIDAKQAKALVDELKPRVVVPMHFRSDKDGFGFDVIGTVEEFTSLFDNVVYYDTNVLELTKDTPVQVAIPKFMNPRI